MGEEHYRWQQEEQETHAALSRLLEEIPEDHPEEVKKTGVIKKLLCASVVLAALGGFGYLGWYAYQFGARPVDISTLDIVKADLAPYKVKPEDPGGMEVPYMDKAIYDSISGKEGDELPKVERILPLPEEPMHPVNPEAEKRYKEVIEQAKQQEAAAIAMQEKAGEAKPVEEKKPEAKRNDTSGKPEETPTGKIPPAVSGNASPPLKTISEQDLKTAPATQEIKKVPVPPAPAQGQYRIQLGAYRSEKAAKAAWQRLNKQHGELLKALHPVVVRKDLGEKGIFYGLQAGPLPGESEGRLLCKKLIERNEGCFFVESK